MPEGHLNLTGAAIRLRMTRNTLVKRLARLGIVPTPNGPCKMLTPEEYRIVEVDHWKPGPRKQSRSHVGK